MNNHHRHSHYSFPPLPCHWPWTLHHTSLQYQTAKHMSFTEMSHSRCLACFNNLYFLMGFLLFFPCFKWVYINYTTFFIMKFCACIQCILSMFAPLPSLVPTPLTDLFLLPTISFLLLHLSLFLRKGFLNLENTFS